MERFRKTINELADLTEEDLQMKVSIDMRLPFPYITEKLIRELEVLNLWKGKSKAVVCGEKFEGDQPPYLREEPERAEVPAGGRERESDGCGLLRRRGECLRMMEQKKVMSFTYYPSVNEYMGRKTLQLTIVNYQ